MPIVVNIAITALTKNKILKNFSTLIREFFWTFIFVDIMIPIIEESAKLKIAFELIKRGHKVIIKDTKSLINEVKKEYGNIFEYIYNDIL